MMKALLLVEQSLPICCLLAALGGILEVAATAVTAIPAVREKEGIAALKGWVQWSAIAGNLGLQVVGSLLSHLVATWFGPVSIVVPFFYSATLLSNMLIFGLLGERFTKNMRVGTHVIVVAVILLPVVGPDIQKGQDIAILFHHWYSIVWFTLLLLACAVSGIALLVLDVTKYSMRIRTVILLVARAASISVNLTVSRAFIMGLNDAILVTFIGIKLISGAIYTYAIVVQSSAVEQARFVPLNATTIIIVNALTGIVIWEDWRVVSSWYGYVCIFVLLGLGCDLLLAVPLLTAENPQFGTGKRASMIGQRAASMITTANRRRRQQQQQQQEESTKSSLRLYISNDSDYNSFSSNKAVMGDTTNTSSPTSYQHGGRASRGEAWKGLLSPIQQSRCESDGDGGSDEKEQEANSSEKLSWHHHPVFQTPQKVGDAIKGTALHIVQQPIQLGGQIAKVANAIVGRGKGQYESSSPSFTTPRPPSPQEEEWLPLAQEQQPQQPPTPHLSRIAAWRDVVSPIRSRSKPSSSAQQRDTGTSAYDGSTTYELWQADESLSSSPSAPDTALIPL